MTAGTTAAVWTRIADAAAFGERQPWRTQIAGKDLLIVKLDGVLHAVDNQCTHAAACLHEGRLRGARIVCPLHGASFDVRTGAVLGAPAVIPLRRYEAREIDGGIEVLLSAAGSAAT